MTMQRSCLLVLVALAAACSRVRSGGTEVIQPALDAALPVVLEEPRAEPLITCGESGAWCGDRCVDLRVDIEHCGVCDNACRGGRCSAGKCLPCPESHVQCDGLCVDPQTDRLHCGATAGCGSGTGGAGARCADDSECHQGACVECPWFRTGADLSAPASPILVVNWDGQGYDDVIVRQEPIFKPIVYPGGLPTGSAIPLPIEAYHVEAVDVDGDGVADLIDCLVEGIEVWRNDGHGKITRTALLPVVDSLGTDNVTTGDFDADGLLDIAAVDLHQKQVRIFYGRGDGTFNEGMPAMSYDEPPYPTLYAVRLNGDGASDLLLGGWGDWDACIAPKRGEPWPASSKLKMTSGFFADLTADGLTDMLDMDFNVSTGLGSGAFSAPVSFEPQQRSARRVISRATADLNGDSLVDLVTVDDDQSVSIWLRRADGGYRLDGEYRGAGNRLWLGNVVGDGALDLITSSDETARFAPRAYEGRGDGTFAAPRLQIPRYRSYYQLGPQDFDQDGRPDFLSLDFPYEDYSSEASARLHSGDGKGGFDSDGRVVIQHVPARARGYVRLADLNGDGRSDVFVSDGQRSIVHVWYGNADGTFAADTTVPHDCPSYYIAGDARDFDHDGDPDLNVGGACLLLNDGRGAFTPASSPIMPRGQTPADSFKDDVDDDGLADLVTQSAEQLEVALARPDNSFADKVRFPFPLSRSHGRVGSVRLIDLNGDAQRDLLVLLGDLHQDWLSISLARADGTYLPARLYSLRIPTAEYNWSAPALSALADLNGDGTLELEVARGVQVVLLSDRASTYQRQRRLPACRVRRLLQDLDGDGLLDLVCGELRGLSIYLGRDTTSCGGEPLGAATKDL